MADKLALVTCASSGIGYELAKELASRGYDLLVCSSGERLEGAANDLERAGITVKAVTADLSTREAMGRSSQ
jgi:uncharacterized protein